MAGLTSKTRVRPAVFALDLNCAIYHCVRKVQQRWPYDPAERIRWESRLIDSVLAYIRQLTAVVNPTEVTYVAVDGVAPMAKIKQQRTRRFKSASAADEEARIKADARGVPYVAQPRWDTNAITPGTTFMQALASALRGFASAAASAAPRVVVSPADEAGEGEQKIMAFLRDAPRPYADAVVYGLDADLIVLALWASNTSSTKVDLFREETEFNGAIKTDALDVEQFLYLDIGHLGVALHGAFAPAGMPQPTFIKDFVALMNLLGNDFVPHGMTLKIRDGGVETLLGYYKTLRSPVLLTKDSGVVRYNPAALAALFAAAAAGEAGAMAAAVTKKLRARVGSTRGGGPEEAALALYNDLPVTWGAERCLLSPAGSLHASWTDTYDAEVFWGADPNAAARAYLDGLAWTLAYYSGEAVNLEWYYPWLLPPRFATLAAAVTGSGTGAVGTGAVGTGGALEPPPPSTEAPLRPIEQLAMVLPVSSFNLLPSADYAELPRSHPHAWPTSWGVYSFGRRFLWECEPLIPLISSQQIRAWIISSPE